MTNQLSCPLLRKSLLVLALLTPTAASAHPGLSGHTHNLISGIAHPLFGFDHLLAMLAIGIFAAQRGGKSLWQLPIAFISLMAVGGIFGANGVVRVPLMEQLIAASVLIFGILIATATKLSFKAILPIVGAFALFHGFAHGAEMPVATSGFFYGIGFLMTTAALHLAGIGVGLSAKKANSQKFIRCAGCLIAACGFGLIFAA